MIAPRPRDGEPPAAYLTRLQTEAAYWRLWTLTIAAVCWPTLLGWTASQFPAAWGWWRLPAALLTLTAAGRAGHVLVRRIAWHLTHPTRPGSRSWP
jgi:hypothetical protein